MPDHLSPDDDARPASKLQIETANRILGWIEMENLPAGYHLKEQQLARIFSLSRYPIRGALDVLARRGVATRRPARGFVLNISGAELAGHAPPTPDFDIDEIYREIATDWFRGKIPEKVSTAELVRRYGGKSTSISKALSRLSADGVIVRTAGKGWLLGSNLATEAAFFQSYEYRMILEPSAILLQSFSLQPALVARARKRHATILDSAQRATIRQMVEADLEFHDMIAESCGNEFLCQTIKRHNAVRRLTEMLSTPDGDRLLQSSKEHMEMLHALENGQRKAAADLMRQHLSVSQEHVPEFHADESSARIERPKGNKAL